MVPATDLTNSCPDILSENGLLYTEPCTDVVTTIMTQLRLVLLDCSDELVFLEQETQSTKGTPPAPSNFFEDNSSIVDLTQPGGEVLSKKRKKAAAPVPVHARSIRKIVTKTPQLLSTDTKSVANAISTSTKSQAKKNVALINKSIQLQQMPMMHTETALNMKTCEQLKGICCQLSIYYPEKIKKADLVKSILGHSNHSEKVLRPVTALHLASSNSTVSMKEVAQLINDGTTTMQKSLLSHVGNLIESKLSKIPVETNESKSSSRSRVSERFDSSDHDALVAATATLAAHKQHSQDTSGLLKQHIEIFSQIAKASTEPVLDAVKTALTSVTHGATAGSTLSQQSQIQQLQQTILQVYSCYTNTNR